MARINFFEDLISRIAIFIFREAIVPFDDGRTKNEIRRRGVANVAAIVWPLSRLFSNCYSVEPVPPYSHILFLTVPYR